jgi:ProP effector
MPEQGASGATIRHRLFLRLPAVPENPTPVAQTLAPDTVGDSPPAVVHAAPVVADLSAAACAVKLAELFPAVFGPGAPRPLKLRVQADVQQRAPGLFTRKTLAIFLQRHTTSTAYLKALVNAPHRVDLDGMPAGEVAEEHRRAAVAELERRRAIRDARRAAERDAQRKAFDEARRQREADDRAQGDRAALLRAYETTTLTRANFCALKGIAEAGLEAALVQARQERERRAQMPRPDRPDVRPEGRGPRPAHSRSPHIRPAAPPKPAR